jgi:hypothetical protein
VATVDYKEFNTVRQVVAPNKRGGVMCVRSGLVLVSFACLFIVSILLLSILIPLEDFDPDTATSKWDDVYSNKQLIIHTAGISDPYDQLEEIKKSPEKISASQAESVFGDISLRKILLEKFNEFNVNATNAAFVEDFESVPEEFEVLEENDVVWEDVQPLVQAYKRRDKVYIRPDMNKKVLEVMLVHAPKGERRCKRFLVMFWVVLIFCFVCSGDSNV